MYFSKLSGQISVWPRKGINLTQILNIKDNVDNSKNINYKLSKQLHYKI